MDFTLSKQQQMVQKMYREFAENEVKPLAKKVDAEEYFPKETVEKMGKLGMMGIYFPTEVGGAGGDVLSYVMAVEELSKVCGTTGVIVSAHTSLCAAPIYENGTPEQKAKYLPKLCSGEWLGAFGLTEPGAGTDAQGQQTFAKQDPETGDWILNGSKIFITNAGYANVFIVIAVTDIVPDKKGRPTKQCSAFIVERTDPGFSVGKAEDKMGIRGSSTCELIFEDCRIPADRMLGVRGRGFQLAMATLDGGRIGIASQALGIAEGALEETVAYVKERKQFGRSISAFQNTQFELAEMKARVEAAKYLVYAAALKKQEAMDGKKVRYSVEAAQAKLIAARTASDVTRRCLQLFGGYGYTRDYPIERSIQSDTAYLEFAFPLTEPAVLMAPPYNRNFSVSVVFPASGWEMIAKVLRFSICFLKSFSDILFSISEQVVFSTIPLRYSNCSITKIVQTLRLYDILGGVSRGWGNKVFLHKL